MVGIKKLFHLGTFSFSFFGCQTVSIVATKKKENIELSKIFLKRRMQVPDLLIQLFFIAGLTHLTLPHSSLCQLLISKSSGHSFSFDFTLFFCFVSFLFFSSFIFFVVIVFLVSFSW